MRFQQHFELLQSFFTTPRLSSSKKSSKKLRHAVNDSSTMTCRHSALPGHFCTARPLRRGGGLDWERSCLRSKACIQLSCTAHGKLHQNRTLLICNTALLAMALIFGSCRIVTPHRTLLFQSRHERPPHRPMCSRTLPQVGRKFVFANCQ